MPRLLVKTDDATVRTVELRPGVNRVGRDPAADFTLTHPSISFTHCDFIVSNDGVFVRDCDSTNGTFVNNQMVKAARLHPGQTVRLADVELTVEFTGMTNPKTATASVARADASRLCRRHPRSR
jgi:pSer/pThr/pTyr-binding forkhead associated (FHA) protein